MRGIPPCLTSPLKILSDKRRDEQKNFFLLLLVNSHASSVYQQKWFRKSLFLTELVEFLGGSQFFVLLPVVYLLRGVSHIEMSKVLGKEESEDKEMQRGEKKTEHRLLGHVQIEQGVRGVRMSQQIQKKGSQTDRRKSEAV